MNDFSQRLRKLRKQKGYTLKEVSKRLGLKTHSTYSNWEYGRTEPDTDTIRKIASIFDVSTDYLLGTNENNNDGFTENQIQLLNEKDLTVSKIKEKYRIDIDGREMTDQEIEELARLIKAWRATKKEQD